MQENAVFLPAWQQLSSEETETSLKIRIIFSSHIAHL